MAFCGGILGWGEGGEVAIVFIDENNDEGVNCSWVMTIAWLAATNLLAFNACSFR